MSPQSNSPSDSAETPEPPRNAQTVFNARYVITGRPTWANFDPVSVVLDPSARYMYDRADITDKVEVAPTLEFPEGRQLYLGEAFPLARFKNDTAAAEAFVTYVMDHAPDKLEDLKKQFGDNPPTIIYEQPGSNNALPSTFANMLAKRLGWPIALPETCLKKYASTQRHILTTKDHGLERLISQPSFSARIVTGKTYFIVDDHFNTGSTVANARIPIEAQGGKVVGFCALNTHAHVLKHNDPRQQLRILPSEQRFKDIQRVIGISNFSDLHKAFFGFPAESIDQCRFTFRESKIIYDYVVGKIPPEITLFPGDAAGDETRQLLLTRMLVSNLVPLVIDHNAQILGLEKESTADMSEMEKLKRTLDMKLNALIPKGVEPAQTPGENKARLIGNTQPRNRKARMLRPGPRAPGHIIRSRDPLESPPSDTTLSSRDTPSEETPPFPPPSDGPMTR